MWEIESYIPECVKVQSPRPVSSTALRQLLLSVDDSGEAGRNPMTWDLEPWQRDFLDLW
jgi:hypothetical protein